MQTENCISQPPWQSGIATCLSSGQWDVSRSDDGQLLDSALETVVGCSSPGSDGIVVISSQLHIHVGGLKLATVGYLQNGNWQKQQINLLHPHLRAGC